MVGIPSIYLNLFAYYNYLNQNLLDHMILELICRKKITFAYVLFLIVAAKLSFAILITNKKYKLIYC